MICSELDEGRPLISHRQLIETHTKFLDFFQYATIISRRKVSKPHSLLRGVCHDEHPSLGIIHSCSSKSMRPYRNLPGTMQTPCPNLNWTLWCHLQFLTSWKTEQAISHLKANARRRESRLKHCFEINAYSISGIARTYFSKDWIAFISSSWWSPPQKPIAPCMADSKLVARLASRTRPSSILSTF